MNAIRLPQPKPATKIPEAVGCQMLARESYPNRCGKPTSATVIPQLGSLVNRDGSWEFAHPWRVCRPHGLWIEDEHARMRLGFYANLAVMPLPPGPYPELSEVEWDDAKGPME